MRALLDARARWFWDNEVAYLRGRQAEIEIQRQHLTRDATDCAMRLRRAEMRQIQYARLS